MNYDIIGDIHGHGEELEILLQKLGYKLAAGVYEHPKGRKVVFLGDYIDRGPKIRETLHIVKNMCDAGNAEAIMGNHEFNAVCFATPDKINGGFYRKHTFTEINQHFETLKQFKGIEDEWVMFLNWFKELPIFIEKKDFRVVHACWDDKHITWLKKNYSGKLTTEFLSKICFKENEGYNVIEETLKGKEMKLQNGLFFHDKDGTKRYNCRLRWWKPIEDRKINSDIMILCPMSCAHELIVDKTYFSYNSTKTVFFGHYWLKGEPIIENNKAICLDYSVAKKGQLVAFKSEYLTNQDLIEKGFVY